jgi:UDP-3-O-[3-hydroxymyristoyl] glucosamine N-acyltransferase
MYHRAMRYTLKELARELKLEVAGDSSVEVGAVASIAHAGVADLVFAEDERALEAALGSKAGAVIAKEAAGAQENGVKPVLISPDPKLAFARAASLLHVSAGVGLGVHPTAIVGKNVTLGLGASIGPHCTVEDNVTLGARTHIGPGCRIGAGVEIADQCRLYANVVVYSGTKIGHRAVVHGGVVLGSDGFGFVRDPESGAYEKFPQRGTLEIGDDVEIGANTTIDRGALEATVIGRGTKIDNLVHIGHNVRVGMNVVIAAQTGISGSAVIEDGAVIAGQVGIADHVTIGAGAILGAQSGVPSNKVIPSGNVVYWGTPARPIKGYLKELATLARLAKRGK